jgi:hypothetical protein
MSLLPQGEKVAEGRMRGTGKKNRHPKISSHLPRPLTRPAGTLSPEGRGDETGKLFQTRSLEQSRSSSQFAYDSLDATLMIALLRVDQAGLLR